MIDMDQVTLLDFLKQYPVADQRTCLTVLDADKTWDWRQLSYRLRPLVRHKYIARRKDGLYSLLAKGEQNTFPFIRPLISCGGNRNSRKRAAEIAGAAALFQHQGMWNRKRLIKDDSDYSWEDAKKRPVSKSPIKLHSDYQHVYLAERHEVLEILETAAAEQRINDCLCRSLLKRRSASMWPCLAGPATAGFGIPATGRSISF